MANTITVSSAGIGIGGDRVSVNNHYYIECGSAGIGIGTNACKIRSGIGSSIVVVDSWEPVDNSIDIHHLSPFRVNCHAATGSTEFDQLYDDGTDYDNGGTHDDTVAGSTAVTLAAATYGTDFDDYTNDTNIVSQTETWFRRTTTGTMYIRERDTPTRRVAEISIGNYKNVTTYDESGTTHNGGLIKVKLRRTSSGYTDMGVCFNMTGSGTAMRGYQVCWQGGGQYVTLYRINGATSVTLISSRYVDYADQDVWYNLHVYYTNTGTTMNSSVKVWEEGTSEPGSFMGFTSDSTYDNPGAVGFMVRGSSTSRTYQFDEFYFEPNPAQYFSSGEWTSDPIDTTSIVNYSYGAVSWDETIPTDTTALVKARWRNDGTWLACTNGGEVPGIDTGEDTGAGHSKDSLELRIELATTDADVTPEIENLRFYHEPLAPDALGIDLDGEVVCTQSDGTLEVWGKQQVSGGVNTIGWDDIWCETIQPILFFATGSSIVVSLTYGGVTIDDIVIGMSWNHHMISDDHAGWQYSMNPIKYASAPVEARYNVQEPWVPGGHGYDWVVIDRSLGIHADASYLIGHYQSDDHLGSLLVGGLNFADHLGSMIVEGYARDDHLGSMLYQAWKRDDQLGFILPAIETMNDQLGMVIIAVRRIDDHLGSLQVMGVNRDGKIEVTMVKDSLWAELTARGYTRG